MGGCTSKPRREEEEVEEGRGRVAHPSTEARGPTNWQEVERANQQANLK